MKTITRLIPLVLFAALIFGQSLHASANSKKEFTSQIKAVTTEIQTGREQLKVTNIKKWNASLDKALKSAPNQTTKRELRSMKQYVSGVQDVMTGVMTGKDISPAKLAKLDAMNEKLSKTSFKDTNLDNLRKEIIKIK